MRALIATLAATGLSALVAAIVPAPAYEQPKPAMTSHQGAVTPPPDTFGSELVTR